jgi:hypothetical protein
MALERRRGCADPVLDRRVLSRAGMGSLGQTGTAQADHRSDGGQLGAAVRMPCRKYGAKTAYTPMLHSCNFSGNEKHRYQEFNTCPMDRHCLSKFCANGPEILLEAARRAEPFCFRSGHDQEGRRTKEEEEKNMEASVYAKRCVEREIACVEGEFRELGRWAFIFLSRVEDSWLILLLLEVCGLNNGLDPAAWTNCIGKQYWASNNWRPYFCSQRIGSNQLLKWRLAGLLFKYSRSLWVTVCNKCMAGWLSHAWHFACHGQ